MFLLHCTHSINCIACGKHMGPNKRLVQMEFSETDRGGRICIRGAELQGTFPPPASVERRNQDVTADRKQRQHVHMFGIRTSRDGERERERNGRDLPQRKGVVPPPPPCGCGPKKKETKLHLPPLLAFCWCQQSTGGSGSPQHPSECRSLRTLDMLFLERLIGCRDDGGAGNPPPTPSCLHAMLRLD